MIARGIKIALITAAALMLSLSVFVLCHRLSVSRVDLQELAPGTLVEVGGHRMHLYSEGEGQPLIFMSGFATSSPLYDFKPLWSRLTDRYEITVVEKAGYGFSETAPGLERDTASLLAETRSALQKAGIEGPYVLVPHSMSILEALLWAHKYPGEVSAILGIDPAIPEAYEYIPIPSEISLKATSLVAPLGLSRFKLLFDDFLEQQGELFSERERERYRQVVLQKTLTKNMIAELRSVNESARELLRMGVPQDIPIRFYIGEGVVFTGPEWDDLQRSFVSGSDEASALFLEAGHYVHHERSGLLAEDMKQFLRQVN